MHSEITKEKIRQNSFKHFKNGMPESTRKKISESMKGIVRSEEHRKNLSISLKGKRKGWRHTKESILKIAEASRGRLFSEETRKKIGVSSKGRNVGDKNGNWKGGYKLDKKNSYACFKYRSNFLNNHGYLYCEICGVSNHYLYEVHHIVYCSEAPKHLNLNNKKNLILLCADCHRFMHSKKSNRNDLVKQRGLQELFEWNLLR